MKDATQGGVTNGNLYASIMAAAQTLRETNENLLRVNQHIAG
jgi:hypothetical protein